MTATALAPDDRPTGFRRFLPSRHSPPVSELELLVLLACNLVATVGLAGDIAQHLVNPFDLRDDFLSGWHLVLYGGVAAVGLWLGVGALRHGPEFLGSVPTAVVGFLLLTVGGAADAVWHEVFGVEVSIEALVSPPHLLILGGLVFLLSTPVVVLWRSPARRLGVAASLCAVASVVFTLLVVSLFTGFLSPLAGGMTLMYGYVEPIVGESEYEYDQIRGLGTVVWTAALFVGGFTPLLVRFRIVPGLVAFGLFLCAVPALLITGKDTLPLVVGFVVAGAVVEAAVALLGRPTLGRGAAVFTGALMAMALWSTTFMVLRMDDRLLWSEALWGGSVVLSGMVGAATAGLVTLAMPSPVKLTPDNPLPHPA